MQRVPRDSRPQKARASGPARNVEMRGLREGREMSQKKPFVLVSNDVRRRVADYALHQAPDGWKCVFSPAGRNLDQSAKFHAICGNVSRQHKFMGKLRTPEAWKVLFISGHAVATKEEVEVVPGIESEFVNIRESSASMSQARMASLIEYQLAYCAQHNIRI